MSDSLAARLRHRLRFAKRTTHVNVGGETITEEWTSVRAEDLRNILDLLDRLEQENASLRSQMGASSNAVSISGASPELRVRPAPGRLTEARYFLEIGCRVREITAEEYASLANAPLLNGARVWIEPASSDKGSES